MGITNQDILDVASTTFSDAVQEVFTGGAPGQYERYTEVIGTDSELNELDVLEAMPTVRKWEGPKQFGDVVASNLTITCVPYEASFSIKRIKAKADRTGMIGRRIDAWLGSGGAGGRFMDQLCSTELLANNTCYDGVSLFSASHPRGPAGATQSNTSTTALSFTQHDAVLQAMTSLRDEEDHPFGISPDTLIVGPKLRKIAMEITGSSERLAAVDNSGAESGTRVAAASIPNVFGGGQMDLVIDPRLVGTYDDHYYYLDTTIGPKPVAVYELEGFHAETQLEMSDESRFQRDMLNFSLEAYLGFGPGAWQPAYAGIL